MSCLKYRALFIFTLFSLAHASFAQEQSVEESKDSAGVKKFTSKECLLAEYETKVDHKGNFWGLMSSELTVKKDNCQLVVLDKGVLANEWKVDVCREPIHIKAVSKGSLSVHKRAGKCSKGSASEFCTSWANLKEALEDKGLIFAKGEREKLSDSHGRIYCAYLLLRKHLDDGILFSKYQDPVNIYEGAIQSGSARDVKEKNEDKKEGKKLEAQGRF